LKSQSQTVKIVDGEYTMACENTGTILLQAILKEAKKTLFDVNTQDCDCGLLTSGCGKNTGTIITGRMMMMMMMK
jgi:hypothetical protein